jgi:hypothetical protein
MIDAVVREDRSEQRRASASACWPAMAPPRVGASMSRHVAIDS